MSAGFRLGIVLRLRELAEDVARADLARAIQVHRAALEALRGSQATASAERDRAAGLQRSAGRRGGSPIGELAEAIASAEWADRERVLAEGRVLAAARALLESRARLAEASRRRQVVERLRDRLAADERVRQRRRDDAVLNEIASDRHAWGALEESRR